MDAGRLLTAKPLEVRMGSGKGNVEYYVAVVKPGRVLYELAGVVEGARSAGGAPSYVVAAADLDFGYLLGKLAVEVAADILEPGRRDEDRREAGGGQGRQVEGGLAGAGELGPENPGHVAGGGGLQGADGKICG